MSDDRFRAMKMAWKRAEHFGVAFDGPFTVTGSTGACIAARNYSLLLDAETNDPLGDLFLLNDWARSINRHCDANKVEGDDNAAWAFASFKSRMFFDPVIHG